tara:strand:+ start:160 stop:1515 length:1356 start_codon:yes stop_codon:yes gene_type:complete
MASTYLSRTLGTPTLATKATCSMWFKLAEPTGQNTLIASAGNAGAFYLHSNSTLRIYNVDSSALTTNRVFRDTSAWYHLVVAIDTTQGTASNRIKVYINGIQETSFSAASYPNQNSASALGNATAHFVGSNTGPANYFNGYMNNVVFVDGTALTPSSFGETDSTSGIWKFKPPSGITFGNNGFHLKMDNSANLGLDSSGETNNFTLSGNGRQAKDTPTNVYATLNPLVTYGTNQNALSEGNNTLTGISVHRPSPPTISVNKGKWYFEAKALSGSATKWWIGLCDTEYDVLNQGTVSSGNNYLWGYDGTSNAVNQRSQLIYQNNLRDGGSNIAISNIFSAGAIAVNDIYAMAVDLDNQKVWYSKNGVWNNGSGGESTTFNASYPDSTNIDAGRDYLIGIGGENSKMSVNYGNGYFGTTAITSAGSNGNGSLFEFDVPSGYYALNTKNINTYG